MVMAEICEEVNNENYKLKEKIKELLSMVIGSCHEGELVLSVGLLLSGMFGVVGGVWVGSFSVVGAGVCFIVIAWLACFLECRRLMKRMNEVWYKLDLVSRDKMGS
ncbi:hypothetical protein C1I88_09405 [Akkermansia muciniphila]|nr:hypothetical protein C1I88_09405 [Akkermansia muciniphila]